MTGDTARSAEQQACGLVALLGWDWDDFYGLLPSCEDDVLLETLKILATPDVEPEPEWCVAKSKLGIEMINTEFERRADVGRGLPINYHAVWDYQRSAP